MTYALRLSVNGDLMGYVSDETVFTEAEKIVQQRITYLDSNTEMFSFDSDYTVEMVGYGSTMTKYQLAVKCFNPGKLRSPTLRNVHRNSF